MCGESVDRVLVVDQDFGAEPTILCSECQEPISEARQRRRAKYCSLSCQRAATKRVYGTVRDAFTAEVPSSTVGAVAELIVAADLLSRGFEVFSAVSPAASCDLAYLRPDGLRRIQVRTGNRRSVDGRVLFCRTDKDLGRQELYAVVLHSTPREIIYLDCDGEATDP